MKIGRLSIRPLQMFFLNRKQYNQRSHTFTHIFSSFLHTLVGRALPVMWHTHAHVKMMLRRMHRNNQHQSNDMRVYLYMTQSCFSIYSCKLRENNEEKKQYGWQHTSTLHTWLSIQCAVETATTHHLKWNFQNLSMIFNEYFLFDIKFFEYSLRFEWNFIYSTKLGLLGLLQEMEMNLLP